jgi:hypothetical protein
MWGTRGRRRSPFNMRVRVRATLLWPIASRRADALRMQSYAIFRLRHSNLFLIGLLRYDRGRRPHATLGGGVAGNRALCCGTEACCGPGSTHTSGRPAIARSDAAHIIFIPAPDVAAGPLAGAEQLQGASCNANASVCEAGAFSDVGCGQICACL